jgi:CDGSH-type Zn-finger protein
MSEIQPTPVTIVACTDGPLLVRGEIEIVSADGLPVPQHRKTIALCRCGASTIKPFCDGTHKLVGFKTEDPAAKDPVSP